MRIKTAMSQIHSFLLALGLVSVFGVGCSGSQQEDTDKLEATDEKAEVEPKAAAEETEAVATAEPAPVTEVAAPAATTTGSVDKNRVVRYVTGDEVIIRGQPNDTAEQVGKLQKGDMILVVEENGWCKVSDTMFIKADALTAKAVARKRTPASWQKPAH